MVDFFQLPKLPFDEAGLEPVFSREMVEIHYHKHHKGYLNKLNQALETYREAEKAQNLEIMLALIPVIQFNGGGFVNHSLFWENLSPKGSIELQGALKEAIDREFGSLEKLISQLTALSVAVPGSGWGWLCWNETFKRLEIMTTRNHDHPKTAGLAPLLCIDVWEHAYYLRYKNARADYLKAIWEIINWETVAKRYVSLVEK